MKQNIRSIGIDDSAFQRSSSRRTFVFGVIVRGNSLVEGVLRTEVTIDGFDATDRIGKMIVDSQFMPELKVIFLNSSTIGALNIIDINELYHVTSIPVIVLLSKQPDRDKIINALVHTKNYDKKIQILDSAPEIIQLSYKNYVGRVCSINAQFIGLKSKKEAIDFLKITTFSGCIPESLRVADLIGRSFKDFILN